MRKPDSSPEHYDGAIEAQQSRTRDRVATAVGSTVDLGMDMVALGTKTGGYVAGRGILAVGQGARMAYRGVTGQSYHTAA